MIARQPTCDLQQLSLLMCDQLDAAQQSKLSQHLDQCSFCRQQLDELTDDDAWCSDAQQTLRDLRHDPDTTILHADSHQAAIAFPAFSPATSTVREEATRVEVTPWVEPWISGKVEQLLLESTHEIDKLRHELSGSVDKQQSSSAS